MLPHICPLLDDPPLLHNDHMIGQLTRERDVVCDEEEGYPCPLRQAAQIVRRHLPDGRIEPLRRLIRQHPFRFARIRHRAEHPLQHADRELMRIGAQHALRIIKAEPREERRILRLVPCGLPRPAPHIRHLAPDAVHGAQRLTRQLRNDAPALSPVLGTQFLLSERGHIRRAEQHLPMNGRTRRQRTEERLPERRLPAAALPDDRRHTPRRKHGIRMIDGRRLRTRIAHRQTVHGKCMLFHHPRTS